MPDVILVDEHDVQIGVMEKMDAHKIGLLHRAFSIFIFNSNGEMLLQQRDAGKYHSAGLWTNACCSHPFPHEETEQSAHRRLKEELGFNTTLKKAFHFTYRAVFPNGLTEYEYDHVFTGIYEGEIYPDDKEVQAYCFLSMSAIRKNIYKRPELYSAWFIIAFLKLEEYFNVSNVPNVPQV